MSRVSNLYNSQAQSGNDYQTVTSASIIIPEGTSSSSLPITILPDQLPELNERFQLNLDSKLYLTVVVITDNLDLLEIPHGVAVGLHFTL